MESGILTIDEQIRMYEEQLKDELKICARVAYYHNNSKDTITALKIKIKEMKDKRDKVEKKHE